MLRYQAPPTLESQWPTPTPDTRLLLPSGITVSGIESWVMNPSTLGARYIYEIGDTLGDMLAWGDCPQIDFTGTKSICLYINRNDNEGYLHWRIDSKLVVRAEGLSKSGLVGGSLMNVPLYSATLRTLITLKTMLTSISVVRFMR